MSLPEHWTDERFLSEFTAKLARCEPPQGQEWVEQPPDQADWARFHNIRSKLRQLDRKEKRGFASRPNQKPHPNTMIGRGES